MTPARKAAAATLLAAFALIGAQAADADGDPASDYLISQNVFFSFTKLPAPSKLELTRVVGEANRRGYTVRVALIGNRFDLGSVPVFWKKPQQYAKFLSQELLGPAPYTNRVLTVMPNGFGLSRTGKDLPADRRALDAVPSAQTRGEDIAAAGVRAVRQLAVLHGVKVDASAPSQGGGAGNDRLVIGGAALAVLALAAVLAVLRSRRARVA
jgi:hypothetical protein